MARIDYTYFTDYRNIANINDSDIMEILEQKIERLESQFFVDVFGYEFQKNMLADPTNPIYEAILNGVEFTDCLGDLVKWEGINESIANYVYFYFYKERTPLTGGVAFAAGTTENMSVVDPGDRLVYAFNKIQPALDILYKFLSKNSDDYPTLIFDNLFLINSYGL